MVQRKLIIPIIIIVIAATISLASIRPVGATGDTLYFSPSNTAAPSTFGNTITISIMADTVGTSSTSGINGWDLVVTDNDAGAASLNPTSISKAGNLLESFGTVSETINCVNGGAGFAAGQPGNIGCDSRDGPGVVHTSAVLQGPATPTPVSGRIARINFTTVGPGPLTIGILSPCPANPAGSCDILIDGSLTPVPHTTRTATYGTPAPPGDFRLSVPNGTAPAPVNPGASGATRVNVTSLSGATGMVSFTQTIYTSGTGTLTFSCTSVTIVVNNEVSSPCTFSAKIPGSYLVTVNATSSGVPAVFHLAPITITISDFKATSNVVGLGVLKGNNTAYANITATSINGFSGSLAISGKATIGSTGTTGLLVSCSPTSISITPTSTATSKCTFTAVKSNRYSVNLYANYTFSGGFVLRNIGMTVVVQDFQITTNPGLLSLGAGKTGSSVVTVSSFPSGQGALGFSGSVAITTVANDPKLTFSCPALSGKSVTVTPSAPASGSCTFGPSPPGAYSLNITGTFNRGTITITNSTSISVMVAADFTITASTASMSVGTTGNSTISVTGYGISAPVSLTYNLPSGLTCPTEPASVTPNNTAVLGCTTNNTGQYNVSITARTGTLTHIAIATFNAGPIIAITKVIASTTTATVGDKVDVTVTISYTGPTTTFTLQIRWGSVTVASKNFTATAGQGSTDYKVTWDTSGYAAGTDIISANIPPLTGETNISGNTGNGPSFTLQPASSSTLSTTTIAIIGVIVAAAAIAGAALLLRRRKKPAAPVVP